jgi:hypothetical protein
MLFKEQACTFVTRLRQRLRSTTMSQSIVRYTAFPDSTISIVGPTVESDVSVTDGKSKCTVSGMLWVDIVVGAASKTLPPMRAVRNIE